MANELKIVSGSINLQCQEFARIYFSRLDKNREIIGDLYQDDAVVSWNGLGINGRKDIESFISNLPAGNHNVIGVKTRPILEQYNSSSKPMKVVILIDGEVSYEDKPELENFQHSIVIITERDCWKITTDCYRGNDCI